MIVFMLVIFVLPPLKCGEPGGETTRADYRVPTFGYAEPNPSVYNIVTIENTS